MKGGQIEDMPVKFTQSWTNVMALLVL